MSSKNSSRKKIKYIKDNMNTEDSLVSKENKKEPEVEAISRYNNSSNSMYLKIYNKLKKIDLQKFLKDKSTENITEENISQFESELEKLPEKKCEYSENENLK